MVNKTSIPDFIMYEQHLFNTVENSNIALKHRLYVSGWCLSGTLVDTRENPENRLVLLHYDDNGVPIGIVYARYFERWNQVEVQVFVRKSQRNKGIGQMLVNRVKEMSPNVNFSWECGVKGSRIFWNKQFNGAN